jgi:hypothetical protein
MWLGNKSELLQEMVLQADVRYTEMWCNGIPLSLRADDCNHLPAAGAIVPANPH